MKNQTNPAMDGIWAPFSKKFTKYARAHRAKFLPDDEFTCNTLARVARWAVDCPETGIPMNSVVTVVQVGPPQISDDIIWRRMKRPYINAVVLVNGEERTCNLESLDPIA
jgi:hypothetical protein